MIIVRLFTSLSRSVFLRFFKCLFVSLCFMSLNLHVCYILLTFFVTFLRPCLPFLFCCYIVYMSFLSPAPIVTMRFFRGDLLSLTCTLSSICLLI